MSKKFTLVKHENGFFEAIKYDDRYVLHLVKGTILNEHYARWILDKLNNKNTRIPEKLSFQ